jgi:hypothetical protein
MRAQDLILLASAHGIDIRQAAKETPREREARCEKFVLRLALPAYTNACTPVPAVSAAGHPSRSSRGRAWTLAELGQAAKGLRSTPWSAVLYAYAGFRSEYFQLHDALTKEALYLRRRHHWQMKITTTNGERHYLADLAELVLDEEANGPLFRAAPGLFAWYLDVSEEQWKKHIAHRYDALRCSFEGWLSRGERSIQRWVSEREEMPCEQTLDKLSAARA